MMTADAEAVCDLAPDAVPAGWDRRLPGGVTRTIRVRRSQVGLAAGRPWLVCSPDGGSAQYGELLIEGPARCVHDAEEHTAAVETEAPILVKW